MSNLDFLLKHHLQNRKLLKKLLSSVDDRQANEIPAGFNNNIIWNCAHVIAVQQSLIYQLCGKSPFADKTIVKQFNIGTKPAEYYDAAFINSIGDLLYNTSVRMGEDLSNENFVVLQPFMTAIKVEITNIEEALAFTNYHEGLHLGVITSHLKCVSK
jgi:hypothetical protein